MKTLVAIVALASACGGGADEIRVEIVTPNSSSPILALTAKVATTAEERRQGLRGAMPLGPNEALLIELPIEAEVCVDTLGVDFAIDVLFVDAEDRVITVERELPANQETQYCAGPAAAVLEVAGGVASNIPTRTFLVRY